MSTFDKSHATVPLQNWYQKEADGLYALAILGGLAFPGALCGALIAGAIWSATREPLIHRLLIAVLGAATAFVLSGVIPGWLGQVALAALADQSTSALSPDLLVRSVLTEMLLGPALVLTLQLAHDLRLRTALGEVADEHAQTMKRSKAMRAGWTGPQPGSAAVDQWVNPAGKIRLGLDESRRPFDLDISEIAEHVSVPGATGSGKTTTLMRVARGALANGHGAIIVDCKGVGLAPHARRLAAAFGLPFYVVDPDDAGTLGYDPCSGDAAHVANKIVGAFTFSAEAEIYKSVAMEIIPVIVRALIAAGQAVTLDTIYDALGKGGLARLGRTAGAEEYRDRLQALETGGGVGAAGYTGLQRRLGALMEGKFGALFRQHPALDWDAVTSTPCVTYFSLSATAASEDVELFGRVVTQDLKQLCDARLRALQAGAALVPVLIMYDEFAALREPTQISDLLLQARQAKMPVVVSTQYIPEELPIRTPVLQAGVLICHRVGSEDANALAAEMGTHETPKLTSQINFETGESELGSLRKVDDFNVHPNVLRELGVGYTAVYARGSNRRGVVHIHKDED